MKCCGPKYVKKRRFSAPKTIKICCFLDFQCRCLFVVFHVKNTNYTLLFCIYSFFCSVLSKTEKKKTQSCHFFLKKMHFCVFLGPLGDLFSNYYYDGFYRHWHKHLIILSIEMFSYMCVALSLSTLCGKRVRQNTHRNTYYYTYSLSQALACGS